MVRCNDCLHRSSEPTADMAWSDVSQCGESGKDIALDVSGDVGPADAKLSQRPYDSTQSIGWVDAHDGLRGGRAYRCSVPESEVNRSLGSEKPREEGPQLIGDS